MEVANGCTKMTRTMKETREDSSKRRKIDTGEMLNSSSLNDQTENQYPRYVNWQRNSLSPASYEISDHVPVSLCSNNESSEFVKDSSKPLDLKAEGLETETSRLTNGGFSRETTPSSDLFANSGELMDSSTTQKMKRSPSSFRLKMSPSKMPSAAEIEEFFAEAEKYDQKLFTEKYNYDVVKDVPLEGRYQWVRLKP
ncbi:hypothetical protein LguiB_007099 [Lonicera macranthoides]